MSYTLAFWQDGDDLDPQDTYSRLREGSRVDGVTDVDAAQVDRALTERLVGWRRDENVLLPPGSSPDEGPAFDVLVAEQYVDFTAYGADGDDLNAIIDVMRPLGFRLYDPQTDDRFN